MLLVLMPGGAEAMLNSTPKGRRAARTWYGVETTLSSVPEVVDLYQARTYMGSMIWLQINNLGQE